MPSVEKPSLYDRLGGVYNIATVVDDFIDRIMHVCAACRIQISRNRDGLLGCGWPAKIHGQVDGGLAFTLEDYWQGMGCVHGRLSADAGQVRGSRRGAGRAESDRQQHPSRYRRGSAGISCLGLRPTTATHRLYGRDFCVQCAV